VARLETKEFLEEQQRNLDLHIRRDSGGPVEVSPAALARLLSMARSSYEDARLKYPWIK
jgi:hypothetical protein